MIWIRADANCEIGIGHIMRCISIAEEIQRIGKEVCFVLADASASELLDEKKLQYFVLNTKYDCMEEELEILEKLVYEHKPDLLLIDSYSVTRQYLEQVRMLVKTAYMDDLGESIYPVDLLINYNIYATKEMYEQNADCVERFLLGAQYAPLRSEFQVKNVVVGREVKNVFISTGGSDKYNLTGIMLDYMLRDEKLKWLNYHVICGRFNVHEKELEQKAENYANIHVYKNVKDMADIMKKCDLAVSAAGSTLYELAALSIPSIIFSFANNQKKAVLAFAEKGAMVSLGHYDYTYEKEFMNEITIVLKELCEDYNKRFDLAYNARRLIDGRGAKRIASVLIESCEII